MRSCRAPTRHRPPVTLRKEDQHAAPHALGPDVRDVPLPAAPACFAGHGGAIARDAETGCTVCSVVSAELFVQMAARGAELAALVHWRAADEAGAAGGSAESASAAVPAAKRRRVE